MDLASPSSGLRPAPTRLWTLDALRGGCALVVFLSHWHLWSNFPPQGAVASAVHEALTLVHDTFGLATWPTGGNHPAVIAFFVLSGFCIHYPFARRALAGGSAPDWRDYFRRRFRRIMPVYWAACALGVVFVAAEAAHPSPNALLQLHALSSTEDLAVRFAAIGALYPKEIFAGNYILVTVTSEIVLYALYPIFFHIARRGHWRALGGFFVALQLVAVVMLLPWVTPFWVFNSIFMVGLFWYLGGLAAQLFLTGRLRVSVASILAVWAAFLALKAGPVFYGVNLLKQVAWSLVCALGILYIVRWEAGRQSGPGVAQAGWLRWCGEISYSLYATHTPAIMLGTWALHRWGRIDYLAQLGVTFGFAAVAALAVHYGIERRFYATRLAGATGKAR